MANLSTQVTSALVIPTGGLTPSIDPGLKDPIGSPNYGNVSSLYTTGLTKQDFTGSGTDELFWQNSKTGDTGIWVMQGAGAPDYIYTGNVPLDSGWKVVGFADFTGDKKTDILWENVNTGDVGYWSINPDNTVKAVELSNIGAGSPWQIQGFFNDGGKAGILWKDTSATDPTLTYGQWHIGADGSLASTNYIPTAPVLPPVNTPVGSTYAVNLGGDIPFDGGVFSADRQITGLINNASVQSVTISDPVPENWNIVSLGAYDSSNITEPLFQSTTGDYGYWQVSLVSGVAAVNPVYLGNVDPNSGWEIINSQLAEYEIPAPPPPPAPVTI